MSKLFLTLLFSSIISVQFNAQGTMLKSFEGPAFLQVDQSWVDTLMRKMTIDEQIGQLFMVAAYSNKGQDHEVALKKLIQDQHIGGLIFFQGGPQRQADMCNRLQASSKIPLMIGMDGEWGLAMRLDSTVHYPYQMTLGAIRNDTIIYEMGKDIGKQFKRMGMHVNFAPVVDVNNNSMNPVINYRSFGEDRLNVAKKGTAYMRGMQSEGVMANAKHFPGHGDTDSDSHLSLPVIDHDMARLDSIELFPFRQMMNRGLSSVMVAHLYIPALDSTKNLASTLSPKVVTGLLRDELRFKGLAFTDALNMKGVASYWKPGEVELKALLAGNDILLFPEDVPTAVKLIKDAIAEGTLSEDIIREHCRRILLAKKWEGLDKYKPISKENLNEDLNTSYSARLNELLYERSITMLKNDSVLVPLTLTQAPDVAYLAIGDYLENSFHKALELHGLTKAEAVKVVPSGEKKSQVMQSLKDYKTVIVGIHDLSRNPKGNFGLDDQTIEFVKALAKNHKIILCHFGNPYALEAFDTFENINTLIISYEDNAISRKKTAEAIMGVNDINGKLPVSISGHYRVSEGMRVQNGKLMGALPEELGIASKDLAEIDSIAMEGIKAGAYPGCVVLVAKKGNIIYEKAFGAHTYDNKRMTETSDVYDLASITKVVSSATAIMAMVDDGLVDITKTLGTYLPQIPDSSVYKDLVLRDILTHQAGLMPWIPFYTSTLTNGKLNPELYRKTQKEGFDVQVAEDVWLNDGQRDSIMTKILNTPLRSKKDYKYSDLGYYFMKAIVEEISGQSLDDYMIQNFYQPMGLETMGYLPLKRIPMDRIVPTEYDLYYRMQLLQGHVHDMGAAMQGGVGGHAGVFSDARDLAAMMQMYLNGGSYHHQQFLSTETVNEFAKCQFCNGEKEENRRGIAFDKPNRQGSEGPTCDCISYESYGHSGFTGTLAWADPEEEIVYVFLSNRIYPSMDNKKLQKMNIRTRIMEAIYMANTNGKTMRVIHPDRDMGLMGLEF
jgi:beta-N-acetylhexosaminidase